MVFTEKYCSVAQPIGNCMILCSYLASMHACTRIKQGSWYCIYPYGEDKKGGKFIEFFG